MLMGKAWRVSFGREAGGQRKSPSGIIKIKNIASGFIL
jgi:hypothetical protein